MAKIKPHKFQALPKVEAHLHLDGTLTPEFIKRLAVEQNYRPLADKTIEEIRSISVVDSPKPSLQAVLNVFRVAIDPVIRSAAALENIAYQMCLEAARQNIIHFEARFCPSLCVTRDLSAEQAAQSALRGLDRGRRETGVTSRLILCLLRDLPEKANEATLHAALRLKNQGVVALDLANNEHVRPLSDFADFFREAKKSGLKTTVHAGESYPVQDFKSILDLGIDRVGHGTHLRRYPDMMEEFSRRKIPIEINLTSNLRTGAVSSLREHPAHFYFEQGIPIILNTDDPAIFDINLNGEYQAAVEEAGFSESELLQIAEGAVDHLFLEGSDKQNLRRKFRCAKAL